MDLGNHSNCMAALFEAAGEWVAVGSEEQKALGVMTLNEVKGATETWSRAKFKLGSKETYTEVPTSFQGSWMSKGQINHMVWQENLALDKKEAAESNSIWSDQEHLNSCGSGHGWGRAEASAQAEQSKTLAVAKLLISSNAEQDFFNATNALQDGQISAGELSKFDSSYLHHEVTGGVTIQQLTDHMKQLLKEKASGSAVQAAQGVLGQAQAWQEDQTACANAGVKQAQGYLMTATNEVLAGLGAVRGLVAMLKLSQRELAG